MREEMTNLRQAAQQALEALEFGDKASLVMNTVGIARNLRAALEAQPDNDTDCHLQGICQRSGYSINSTKED